MGWGRLFGRAEMVSADELAQVERDIWSAEAVSTAAIEGETLDLASVHSSVARRLGLNFNEEAVLGKTGTCSHAGTRFGWFASYANTSSGRVVVVVFLQGGRPTFGPKAAEIAGLMYRNLFDHNFFIAGTSRPADSAPPKPGTTP